MTFYTTSITTQSELRTFSFRTPSLEVAFNVLSAMQKSGDKLLSIKVVEAHRAMVLPAEVFDGQDFSLPLTQLEQQWQNILQVHSDR